MWKNGSITHLMSTEQDDMVFEGSTIDFAWFDEPPRRSIYIATKRGLMVRGGVMWITATPLDEPWLYDELYLPGLSGVDKDIEVFEGTIFENLSLPRDEIERFKRTLTEDEIETRLYGKFRHLSGRVFKEYRPERHFIPSFDIPRHWPVWCGIDPHRNKENAVVWIAVSPDNKKYVCNEIYHKCTINELADYIIEISSQYNMVEYLIDTSAQEDGWDKISARQMLSDKGLHTRLAQKRNKKMSGIALINQLLKDDSLFAMQHCKRFNRELINQVYKKNKRDEQIISEEPEKKFDDMCFVKGTLVATSKGDAPIEKIKVGDEILTPFGFRKALKAGPTQLSIVIEKRGLKGTRNHPVYLKEKNEFVELQSLTDRDTLSYLTLCELIKWNYLKILNSMESNIDLWGRESIILVGKKIIKKEKVLKDFMWQFGNFILERKFQKACSFIISMAILLITTLKTWSVYRIHNTLSSIQKILKDKRQYLIKFARFLRLGILLKLAENGIQSIARKFGKIINGILLTANYVAINFQRRFLGQLSFVAGHARLKKEGGPEDGCKKEFASFAQMNSPQLSIKKYQPAQEAAAESSTQEIVYNLTVEDNHVYYANSILVHNTDCARYVLIENPSYRGLASIKAYGPSYQRIV